MVSGKLGLRPVAGKHRLRLVAGNQELRQAGARGAGLEQNPWKLGRAGGPGQGSWADETGTAARADGTGGNGRKGSEPKQTGLQDKGTKDSTDGMSKGYDLAVWIWQG